MAAACEGPGGGVSAVGVASSLDVANSFEIAVAVYMGYLSSRRHLS